MKGTSAETTQRAVSRFSDSRRVSWTLCPAPRRASERGGLPRAHLAQHRRQPGLGLRRGRRELLFDGLGHLWLEERRRLTPNVLVDNGVLAGGGEDAEEVGDAEQGLVWREGTELPAREVRGVPPAASTPARDAMRGMRRRRHRAPQRSRPGVGALWGGAHVGGAHERMRGARASNAGDVRKRMPASLPKRWAPPRGRRNGTSAGRNLRSQTDARLWPTSTLHSLSLMHRPKGCPPSPLHSTLEAPDSCGAAFRGGSVVCANAGSAARIQRKPTTLEVSQLKALCAREGFHLFPPMRVARAERRPRDAKWRTICEETRQGDRKLHAETRISPPPPRRPQLRPATPPRPRRGHRSRGGAGAWCPKSPTAKTRRRAPRARPRVAVGLPQRPRPVPKHASHLRGPRGRRAA